MKSKKILLLLIAISLVSQINAEILNKGRKDRKKEQTSISNQAKKDTLSPYEKFFKEKHESKKGMFILHKMKEKVYFEIPINMLEKEMLMASTVTETSDNANGIVGGKGDPLHVKFSKAGQNIQLRRINSDVITDNQSSPIASAIKRSSIGSVMKSMKIETYSKDSSSVVIDVTGLFVSDFKDLTPFDKYSQYTMFNGYKRTESFQQDKSFVNSIKAFSDNISVISTLSYNYTLTDQRTSKTVVKDEPFTAIVTRSIVLLPEIPVRPRYADYRVAVFNTGKYFFGEKEQSSKVKYYANRWNLEPKDKEAFKKGMLSEPIKPIVFYIDDNFPSKWRSSIKEGVEQWNEMFEKIGFKNAIKALDFPKDDPEFDPDNIKYSCIRYAPIGIQNAMGPSWVDPRSGEIINASVYIYHDIVKLLNNWMFVQISPADNRLRSKNIPEDILFDGLRYVVSHEVGHCLGFMHNMSASSVIPVDSLRSATFTNKSGTTTSIMDYARFNYVAQPGDREKGVKLTPPRFGEYDKFLIKWNYKYFPEIKTAEEEEDMLSLMVSSAIKEPVYRYGKQLSYPLDPRSQTEDLGDDAIKASEYGIKNLKYLISNLDSWVGKDDEDFSYRTEIYDAIVFQYIRYINHVFANIGGVYLNEVKVSDNMVPFKSVEKEKQIASLKFIMGQIDQLDWMNNKELNSKLTIMGSAADLLKTVLAKAVVAAPSKVVLSASISEKPFDFYACSDMVYEYVWGPAIKNKELTDIQKFIQNEFINTVVTYSNVKKLSIGVNIFEIASSCGPNEEWNKKLLKESEVLGYGVPSMKFNVVFNPESNYYRYLSKAKKLLENKISIEGPDKYHYDLLLKKINSSLKIN